MRLSVLLLLCGLAACSPYAHRAEVEALGTATLELGALGDRQRDWEIAHRRSEIGAQLRELHAYARSAGQPLPGFGLDAACGPVDTTSPCRVVIAVPASAPQGGDEDSDQAEIASLLGLAVEDANERITRPIHYTNSQYRTRTTAAGMSFELTPADQFAVLQRYASALLAITEASDLEELEKAHGSVSASLAGLMQEVGPDGEAEDRAALGSALAGLFGAARRAQLNRRRLAVLRHVVGSSDESFRTVLGTTQLYVETVRAEQVEALRNDLRLHVSVANARLAERGLSADSYVALYEALEGEAGTYSSLRSSHTDQAFGAVARGHAALATALRDNSRQWIPVAELAHSFASSVESLNEAVDAFEEDGDGQSDKE